MIMPENIKINDYLESL